LQWIAHPSRWYNTSTNARPATAAGPRLSAMGHLVHDPVRSRIFSSSRRPGWLWGISYIVSSGYWGSFSGGKVARTWSWTLTPNQCRGHENVDSQLWPSTSDMRISGDRQRRRRGYTKSTYGVIFFGNPISFAICTSIFGWHAVAQWLRRYVTNRKVACSRPDEVNDFYQVT
jgi:hypothetical protein